jgi:serine/threonine-protein kinase
MQSAHELIGRTLQGRFVITDLLGEGAMGIVYRGFDQEKLSHVAVKILQPALAGHPEIVARFFREGSASRRVAHENAVRFLEKGQDDGIHFLVMELLDGRCLADLLAVERRVQPVRAARMMVQVCDALAVAHAHGIVHRDLKPENVMISGHPTDPLGEHVKLLDFGIAKRVSLGASAPVPVEDSFNTEDLTACGALIGTPEYMAPEQCRGLPVDARTDVYACGVVLFRLVTGQVPFTADHLMEVCQLHLSEPPRRPGALVPGIHAEIEAVILKALAKDPGERQQGAAALREELLHAVASILAAEQEITGVREKSALVPDELAETMAADLAETVAADLAELAPPPAEEPATQIYVPVAAPRARWREHLPVLAACAAVGAGMASLLITLSVLFRP